MSSTLDAATARDAVAKHGSQRKAAAALGVSQTGVRLAILRGDKAGEFEVPPMPTSNLPIEELLARRCEEFARVEAAEKASKLIPVKVNVSGPFGIVHFGDPHLDDPGCDMPKLLDHVRIVNETPGLMGACIGDYTNNWCGRLERLYAKQETKQSDAVRLGQWFIKSVPWMYLVGGNHDVWSGAIDPMKMLAKMDGMAWKDHGIRLALKLPNKRELRISARHTFNGHSMWNASHGQVKAARMGHRDHIYVSGHTHTFSHMKIPSIGCELMHHLCQVGAYKRYDDYADQGGFPDYNAVPAVVTIVDPDRDELTWIHTFDDVAEAAEFLTWKRSRSKVA